MKRLSNWQVVLGFVLIILAALFYYIHFLIFRDPHHIMIFFFGDLAFVFFEVLLVMLIIHRLLHHREKRAKHKKINMLVGAFFSEVGTELLRKFSSYDPESERITGKLQVPEDWSEKVFLDIRERVSRHDYSLESEQRNLQAIRDFLLSKKQFLLDLLLNQNLLENESFTNLVWALFHLTEEMEHRHELRNLTEQDYRHLTEDIRRVYQLLTLQWMDYINHLKKNYPYLFSLALRKNPFQELSSVEIT